MMDKEPNRDWLNYPWDTWLFMLGFSIWGGLANLVQRYRNSQHRRFSLTEAIGELTISAFAGIVIYNLCDGLGVPRSITAAFVGISGHMGSRLIYVLEHWLKEKLGTYLGIKDPTHTPEQPLEQSVIILPNEPEKPQ